MSIDLTSLNPRWFTIPGACVAAQGIHVGLSFDCPCCVGTERATQLAVPFDPPIDPDGLLAQTNWDARLVWETVWGRTGDQFDTLTLTPSVDASSSGHWHGFITKGKLP